jgi:hypothetical protein
MEELFNENKMNTPEEQPANEGVQPSNEVFE